MITTTTTTRSHRGRRVAAAALVGVGLVSLGVASASHLNVTAQGDLVASGVDVDVEGFLGPDATADVKVTYDLDAAGATLKSANTLAPTAASVSISGIADVTIPSGSEITVYFYKSTSDDPVAEGTVTDWSQSNRCETSACTLSFDAGESDLSDYDRVAVVAVSGDYDS